jgi:lipopolysaccharide transport system ATP-binding protein
MSSETEVAVAADVAVAAKDLSKCYRIFSRTPDRLKQAIWRGRQYYREFWALKNLSLRVKRGETMGIIGRNGSGKSTLLQLIAGTLTPTSGEVAVKGRVAALLELGSGFNPEFTGRENVFLNGAILGLSRQEVETRFDEIADFADIGAFLEQPVKYYSSGMVIRLAFAVQAFVPKDVLIVDEALAVGDEAFQQKCFGKIREFKRQGGTIIFVSHAPGLIVELCDRAILLDEGELLLQGASKPVVNLYQRLIYSRPETHDALRQKLRRLGRSEGWEESLSAQVGELDLPGQVAPGGTTDPHPEMYDPSLTANDTVRYESRGAKILDPCVTTPGGERVNLLKRREPYIWRYRVFFDRPAENVRFAMMIKTVTGYELGGAVTAPPGGGVSHIEAGTTVEVELSFRANLAGGTYSVNAGVLGSSADGEIFLDRCVDAVLFKSMADESLIMSGTVDFNIEPRFVIKQASTTV